MERRKFVIGAGALATGSAAAMGTGAFSSVDADRSISVGIESDDNAYLRLEETSEYASGTSDGTLELDFTNNGEGDGFNAEAYTIIEETFKISNQGTDPVRIYIDSIDVNLDLLDEDENYLGPRPLGFAPGDNDGEGFNFDVIYDEEEPGEGPVRQYRTSEGVSLNPGDSADVTTIMDNPDTDTIDFTDVTGDIRIVAYTEDSILQDQLDAPDPESYE